MQIDGMFFGNVMLCFRYNKISLKDVSSFSDISKRENLIKNKDGSYDFIDHNESLIYENAILIKIGENNYIMYNDIKESLENKLKAQPNKKQIEILTTTPTGVGKIFVDKSSLKQCYVNSYEYENKEKVKSK